VLPASYSSSGARRGELPRAMPPRPFIAPRPRCSGAEASQASEPKLIVERRPCSACSF
jgi:hypothetical protein